MKLNVLALGFFVLQLFNRKKKVWNKKRNCVFPSLASKTNTRRIKICYTSAHRGRQNQYD